MTSTSFRSVAAVGIAAVVLVYVGCNQKQEAGPTVSEVANDRPAPEPASEAKVEGVAGHWPMPEAVLLISGQQLGYLEPCGCTEGQTGGLGRRMDLVQRLKERGWPVFPIDLGSLIEDPATSRGGPEQVRIKLDIAMHALEAMGYEALTLSPDDLKLGIDPFFGQYLNVEGAPTLLAANVTLVEGLEEVINLRPVVHLEAENLRVGITAVLDPEAFDRLRDEAKDAYFASIDDPDSALSTVLADLESSADVRVLLVQGSPDLARELAERFPGFQVVVATSEYDDPRAQPERLNDGRTQLISVGKKGKYVGLLGLFDDRETPSRYLRVVLDTKFNDDAEPVHTLIAEDYPRAMEDAQVLESFVRSPHPSGAQYVGAETCMQCHPNTFDKWTQTKHFHAYDALLDGPRGNRTMDAECISCHTTGFGFDSGFITADLTPALKHQQCENCHGPGSLHVTDPLNPDYRQHVALTAEAANKGGLCVRCHDGDNDPNFKFEEYYPMIAHKGLDNYDNPKVRQGLDLEEFFGRRQREAD